MPGIPSLLRPCFWFRCTGLSLTVLFCLIGLAGAGSLRAAAPAFDPDVALWRAVLADDLAAAEAALAEGAYVDAPYRGPAGDEAAAGPGKGPAWPSVEVYGGATPLTIAVGRGADDMARFLLAAGANPDARSVLGRLSPLVAAAGTGDKALFDELRRRGATVHQSFQLRQDDGAMRFDLLRPAVWGGNVEIIEALRGAGVPWPEDPAYADELLGLAVAGTGEGRFTGPAMFAYLRRHQVGGRVLSPEQLQHLLEVALRQGSDDMLDHVVALAAKRDEALLVEALRFGRTRLVLQLLDGGQARLDGEVVDRALGRHDILPPGLMLALLERGHRQVLSPYVAASAGQAIRQKRRDIFHALVAAGYDGHPPAQVAGRWLDAAIASRQPDLAAELLSMPGIDLNTANVTFGEEPPLARALMEGDTVLVPALLGHGARGDLVDRYFAVRRQVPSTMHLLCMRKLPAAWVKPLVATGARLDVRDRAGRLPVHCAAATGQLALLRALVDAGAGLDEVIEGRSGSWTWQSRDDHGKTPLMLAIENAHDDVVAWLLRRGARMRVGKVTALGAAIVAGNVDAIGRVLGKGEDPGAGHASVTTREPVPALRLAVQANQPAALSALLAQGVRAAEPAALVCDILQSPGLRPRERAGMLDVALAHGLPLPPACDDQPVMVFADSMELARLMLARGAHVDARVRQGPRGGATSLMLAVAAEDIRRARVLIGAGADVNATFSGDGTDLYLADLNHSAIAATPLQLAAERDRLDLVQLLLAAGAAADRRGPGGYTALMVAAARGHPGIARLLLAAGADPEARSDGGGTAASMAAAAGHEAVLAVLLEHGSPGALTASLVRAAQNGEADTVSSLLAHPRMPAEALSPALLAAVEAGLSRVVNRTLPVSKRRAAARQRTLAALLAAGADPDTPGLEATPLLMLARSRFPPDLQVRLARQLVAAGADPDARAGRGGMTPLMLAAARGRCRLVRTLLDLGATPDLRGPGERTALLEAASSRWAGPACLAALLKAGADPNATDADGDTALARLSRRGSRDPHSAALVTLLADAGARVDKRNKYGYTPLALALKADARALAEALLVHGGGACVTVRGRRLPAFTNDEGLRTRLEAACP